MYYPYLRGKQFELIALRELSAELPDNHYLSPIIEPVKLNFSSLNTAVKEMKNNGQQFVLIVNPSDGDFKNNPIDILDNVTGLEGADWKPALLYKHNCHRLQQIIDSKHLQEVFIIFADGIDFDQDEELEGFLSSDSITKVVVSNADTRFSKRMLQQLGKSIIRLDDNFKERRRNVDYIEAPEEQFTEEPFFYSADGFSGFSDYTTLSKAYSEGGMLPYAVAIHLTYKPAQQMVYIRHFVSESNIDQSNIQGKFAEATRKAVAFFNSNHSIYRGSAIDELEGYLADARYPGLGVIKKISVKHHLQLITHILDTL